MISRKKKNIGLALFFQNMEGVFLHETEYVLRMYLYGVCGEFV